MVKIRKYTLKNKHKNRLTGGSDNNRNLNRKQRRQFNRALPKLQAAIRRRISNNSPTPSAHSTVLPEPQTLIPQTLPIIIPQTSPITVPPTLRTRRRRGRRTWRSQTGSPILWYNISPEEYLRQTQNIPVLQPIPIPAAEPVILDSEDNEIITINDESNNEYQLSIDRKGNVTVLKDGSLTGEDKEGLLDDEEDSQDQTGGTPNQDLINISMGQISTGNIDEEIEKLQTALDNGANINTRDNTGRTALSHAVSDSYYHNTGNSEIVEFLLENGADVNLSDNNDMTPLIWSVTYSNIEFARILLENNANPNIPDGQLDQTPLHIATQIPFLDLVILLLENGANVNPVDMGGDTPLHVACTHTNNPRMFEILLRYGANENIPNHGGQTASDLIQIHPNPQLRNILVDTRRQIDSERISIDSLSRQRNISDNVMGFRVKKYLRKTGGKKKMKLIGGTPDDDLLQAVIDNDYAGEGFYVNDALLDKLRIAIESGANVNIQTNRGYSPLIFLAKSDVTEPNIEMVDLLLRNGANPNLQDRGGETALHWASVRGFLEMVEKLLESENIDINITNIDGRNALHSIFDDEEEIFNPDNVEPIMKLLIEKGININETDDSGKTALHLAAEQNRGVAIGVLLRAGADENIKTYDYHPAGQTAYELAENIRNRIELRRNASVLSLVGEAPIVPDVEGDEDDDNNPWVYEPLALNAFHEFHDERAQAAISNVYLAQEAKNEDSYLNSLPDELEEGIRNMFGGSRTSPSATHDLLDALRNNDLEKMRIAIESGADVNTQWSHGRTALIHLAEFSAQLQHPEPRLTEHHEPNIEMVDLLLNNNADPNLQDSDGDTALNWATARGYLEVVEKLLENENIEINKTNFLGRNALHIIFTEWFEEDEPNGGDNAEPIMKLLIEKGININEPDNSGKTPLHLAAEQNNSLGVGILLRAGANENIKTGVFYIDYPDGHTAYELAEKIRNRIELDRNARLGEIIGVGNLTDQVRITHMERDLVRAVMTVGEEERSLQIPRDILVDEGGGLLWAYEPVALNAFHEFHDERAQAAISNVYLAQEAENEDSYLNSLPDDLIPGIRNMFGGTNKSNRKKFFKDLKGRNSRVKRIISEKYGEDVKLVEEHTHVDSEGHYVYKLKFKGNVTNNEWVYITPLRIANTPKNEDWISIVNNQIINDISNELDKLEIPQVKNFQPKKNSPKKQSKDTTFIQKHNLNIGYQMMNDEPDKIKQQEPDESEEEPDENEAARLAEHVRLDAERREEDELAAWVKELEFDSINTKAAEKEDAHIKGVTSLTRADEPPPPPPRKQPHLTALERRRAKKEKLRNSRSGELESPPTPPPPDDEDNRLEAAWNQSVREQRGYEESQSTEPLNPIPEPHTTHSSADLAKLRNQDLKRADSDKQENKSKKKARKKERERLKRAETRRISEANKQFALEMAEAERQELEESRAAKQEAALRGEIGPEEQKAARAIREQRVLSRAKLLLAPGTSVKVKGVPFDRYVKWKRPRPKGRRETNKEDYENGWIRGTVVESNPSNEGNIAPIYSVLLPNLSMINVYGDTDDLIRETRLRFSLNTIVEVLDTGINQWKRGRVVRLKPYLNDEKFPKGSPRRAGVYIVSLDDERGSIGALVDHDMLIRIPITSEEPPRAATAEEERAMRERATIRRVRGPGKNRFIREGGAYNKTLKEIVQDFKVSNNL